MRLDNAGCTCHMSLCAVMAILFCVRVAVFMVPYLEYRVRLLRSALSLGLQSRCKQSLAVVDKGGAHCLRSRAFHAILVPGCGAMGSEIPCCRARASRAYRSLGKPLEELCFAAIYTASFAIRHAYACAHPEWHGYMHAVPCTPVTCPQPQTV